MNALETIRIISEHKRSLGDMELENSTWHLRRRIDMGTNPADLIPEAMACACEAVRRFEGVEVGERELAAAVRLCEGGSPENVDNSGLVAVLVAYFHSLTSNTAVHVVVMDDDDAAEMWRRFEALNRLGAEVGIVQSQSTEEQRREGYAAEILVAPFGRLIFDYLHDRLARAPDERQQRARGIAVVDRADLLLGPLAREQLNISAPREIDEHRFRLIAQLAYAMRSGRDYLAREADKSVSLTRRGVKRLRRTIDQTDLDMVAVAAYMRDLEALLTARQFYRNGREYEIVDSEIHWNVSPHGILQAAVALDAGIPSGTSQVIACILIYEYFSLYRVVCALGKPKRPAGMDDLIELDQPLTRQRHFVYTERDRLVDHQPARQDVEAAFRAWLPTALARTVGHGISEHTAKAFWEHLSSLYPLSVEAPGLLARTLQARTIEEVGELALTDFQDSYRRRVDELTREDIVRDVTRRAVLAAIDREWPKHLSDMELLRFYFDHQTRRRTKIAVYRREADRLFEGLLRRIQGRTVQYFFTYKPEIQVIAAQVPQ